MNYFLWEDLVSKYRKLASDYQSEIQSSFIPAACAFVDASVAVKYSVPFTPAPYFIKDLAVDVCYWEMTYKEENQDRLKEFIDERIAGIVNGTIVLTDPNSGAQLLTPRSNVFLTTSGTASSFGVDNPVNFAVDSSWQQSFQSDRGQF